VSGHPGLTEQVLEFHRAFGLPVQPWPAAWIDGDLTALRQRLLDEEVQELRDAVAVGDVVEIADALADIAYIVAGTAVVHGIDLDAVIREVHRSNMAKLGPDGRPILRADGKVLKPEGWEPPRIHETLRASPLGEVGR